MIIMMRYPGGKLRLQKKINVIIREVYPESDNNWIVGEPFSGGGGSLINMAEQFPKWQFHINDYNPEVYTFWKFFIGASETEINTFYDKFRKAKVTLKSYNYMFDSKPTSDIDRAFRILFLNKTSFGGYITQKLPIGGKEQKSKWKVDVYWNPENIIKKCKRARASLQGRVLSVNNLDCNEFILKNKYDFIYADPPYILYGKQWYNCEFDISSLKSFREGLNKTNKWCVSMDSLVSTRELFENDDIKYVNVKHTAKSLTKGKDTIASAKELVVFPK